MLCNMINTMIALQRCMDDALMRRTKGSDGILGQPVYHVRRPSSGPILPATSNNGATYATDSDPVVYGLRYLSQLKYNTKEKKTRKNGVYVSSRVAPETWISITRELFGERPISSFILDALYQPKDVSCYHPAYILNGSAHSRNLRGLRQAHKSKYAHADGCRW